MCGVPRATGKWGNSGRVAGRFFTSEPFRPTLWRTAKHRASRLTMRSTKQTSKVDAVSKALNERELRFIEQILAGATNREAAILAGYSARSAHVTASRLLRKAKVAHALKRQRDRRAVRTGIIADRV